MRWKTVCLNQQTHTETKKQMANEMMSRRIVVCSSDLCFVVASFEYRDPFILCAESELKIKF